MESGDSQALPAVEASSAAPEDHLQVLRTFHTDPMLANFLDPSLLPEGFASEILASGQAVKCVSSLAVGVDRLVKEIRKLVLESEPKLAVVVARTVELERTTASVRVEVRGIRRSMDVVSASLLGPAERLSNEIFTLQALQKALDLLRVTGRFLSLAAKLRSVMSGVDLQASGAATGLEVQLPKAALRLADIEELLKEADLNEIAIIRRELRMCSTARGEITRSASLMLQRGLLNLSQTETSAALQTFFNLRMLPQKLTQVLAALMGEASGAIERVLVVPATASDRASRQWPWAGLERLVDSMGRDAEAVAHLEAVLRRKRDPVTRARYVDIVAKEMDPELLRSFGSATMDNFEALLSSASEKSRSSSLREALENDFPRLQVLLRELASRFQLSRTFERPKGWR